MVPRVVALLLFVVSASGCADSEPVEDASPSPSDPSMNPGGEDAPPEGPPPATATLHLLVAPSMGLRAENGTQTNQSVVTYRGGLEAGEGATWRYTLSSPATLGDLESHLWIKVTESLAVQPSQGGCVWTLSVSVTPSGGAVTQYPAACSPPTGPTIAPATYELVFRATGSGGAVDKGAAMQVNLRRFAFSPSPNDAVFALSGTDAIDSRVTIAGLREPVPPA